MSEIKPVGYLDTSGRGETYSAYPTGDCVPLYTVDQIREMVERVKDGYVWSNHNMMSEHGSKETEWALSALDALLAQLEEA